MAVKAQIDALVNAIDLTGYAVYDVSADEYQLTDRSDEIAICVTEEDAEFVPDDDSARIYNATTRYTIVILVHSLSGGNAHTDARTALDAVLGAIQSAKYNRERPIIEGWNRVPEDSLNKARYEIRINYNTYEDYR